MSRYLGRGEFGSNNLYRISNGYKTDGLWWQKLLATVVALFVVVGIFALIFWWGAQ